MWNIFCYILGTRWDPKLVSEIVYGDCEIIIIITGSWFHYLLCKCNKTTKAPIEGGRKVEPSQTR